LTLVAVALGAVNASPGAQSGNSASRVMRLATTTSTSDSGLLQAILPGFESVCGCRVDVIAVGTGQALEIGRRGDADVVLVHARAAEDQFVADRHARERHDVMHNDFVIVGPRGDPAKIAGILSTRDAFAAIARARAPFVSRGDKSGTHTAELAVWTALKVSPGGEWYRSLGQGMGETLVVAHEQRAYTLTDRGTWLSMREKLPDLEIVVGGRTLAENRDPNLRNAYGVMAVNPDTHPSVNFALASRFVEWLLSAETQRAIGEYGVKRYGQPLFYPDAPKTTRKGSVKDAGKTRTFTLADLQALRKALLVNSAIAGGEKGPIGSHAGAGAPLRGA
jgi:tungstate transport system substrate-binding protein